MLDISSKSILHQKHLMQKLIEDRHLFQKILTHSPVNCHRLLPACY